MIKRIIVFLLVIYLNSCGYPDIDSVPNFKKIMPNEDNNL